jgi:hypothetical protein
MGLCGGRIVFSGLVACKMEWGPHRWCERLHHVVCGQLRLMEAETTGMDPGTLFNRAKPPVRKAMALLQHIFEILNLVQDGNTCCLLMGIADGGSVVSIARGRKEEVRPGDLNPPSDGRRNHQIPTPLKSLQ